jgi:hypothetical protein
MLTANKLFAKAKAREILKERERQEAELAAKDALDKVVQYILECAEEKATEGGYHVVVQYSRNKPMWDIMWTYKNKFYVSSAMKSRLEALGFKVENSTWDNITILWREES